MEIAVPSARSESFSADFVRAWLELWLRSCEAFREWERADLIKKRPSPDALAKHKKVSSSLIRSAHMLELLMEDPDYPSRELLPEVQGKLWQLQETREMLHNPMSDADVDDLLQKFFPDEPAVGRIA